MSRYSIKGLVNEGIEIAKEFGYWSKQILDFNDKIMSKCKSIDKLHLIHLKIKEEVGEACWNRLPKKKGNKNEN